MTTADTKNLTRAEQQKWRERLSRWHTPAEMKEAVDELYAKLPDEVLFNQPGLNFAHESWDAAIFAQARRHTSVRLVNDEWPDFEVCTAEGVQRFEHIEADRADRRRGLEYQENAEKVKRGESLVRHMPDDYFSDRPKLIAQALRDRTTKKHKKRYGRKCNLLIVLNLGAPKLDEVAAILHPSTEGAKADFDEIWLLWRDYAYLLWRHGERVEVALNSAYNQLWTAAL